MVKHTHISILSAAEHMKLNFIGTPSQKPEKLVSEEKNGINVDLWIWSNLEVQRGLKSVCMISKKKAREIPAKTQGIQGLDRFFTPGFVKEIIGLKDQINGFVEQMKVSIGCVFEDHRITDVELQFISDEL